MIEADSIEAAIQACFGDDVGIAGRESSGGGCIAAARSLRLDDGRSVFCKSGATSDLFAAEADGLAALAASGAVRVPRVLARSRAGADGFLLMEHVPSAVPGPDYWPQAGRALAALHALPQEAHGWHRDNYIGASPQYNRTGLDWPSFFAHERLGAQLRLLEQAGGCPSDLRRCVAGVQARIGALLPEAAPSLVHGDLWNGNLISDGSPVYIDPAVHCAHREVDLAMTELFGGFPAAFYDAYREAIGIEPGYRERRDLYNSYHMLNHALLFGGGYLASARSLLQRFL